MDSPQASFACAGCGKTYRWKPELAGRKVKCACGHVMLAPAAEPVDEPDLYDIVDDNPAAKNPATPRPVIAMGSPAPAIPAPVAAHPKAVSYARRETIGTSAVDVYFPDRVKDLYLPLALIGGGTLIEIGIALFSRSGAPTARTFNTSRTLTLTLVGTCVYMIANTVLMLLTVFIVAKLRDISFGPMVTAIIKLCAISIGPGAIGSLVSLGLQPLICIGGPIGWVVGFVLYFASIGALFDLDASDTWYVVVAVFLVKVAIVLMLVMMLR